MQDKKISIIISVKNNVIEIDKCTTTLFEIKNKHNLQNLEIIYIDDFSEDDSWQKIKNNNKKFPQFVKGIKLGLNYGQQLSSYIGIKHALNSEYVITLDCDLEDDPNSIIDLINKINEKKYDCILGVSTFKGSFFYKLFSKIFYFIQATWSEVKETSRHTNLRIFNKSCVNSLMRLNPFFFQLTQSPAHINAKIGYLKVNKILKKRVSSYSLLLRIKLAIKNLFEFSSFISWIFLFLLLTCILFLIFYYFYNIYILITEGSLAGFFSLITFLIVIIFMISVSFFYLNHKLNSIIQFLYKGIDKKTYEDYFNILEKIGFD